MKIYKNLTKFGIVVFAMAGALAGYAMSFRAFQDFVWTQPALLLVGLYILCSGSFAINQAQEWRLDCLMDRTKNRPIPSGRMSVNVAFFIASIASYVHLARWKFKTSRAVY